VGGRSAVKTSFRITAKHFCQISANKKLSQKKKKKEEERKKKERRRRRINSHSWMVIC
jgi:hypothetical protein